MMMQVIEVDPKKCVRWGFADRSAFEFGDVSKLAEDIVNNGQIEPAILRKSKNPDFEYEVIAGSRRWKACLEAGIKLKGIVQDLSDEQAAVAQIKENQQLSICDYSKGIYYSKLLAEKKTTRTKLAKLTGYSLAKLDNFLDFQKIPDAIWGAVGNPSKVSSRTAATILSLCQNGKSYMAALIGLAGEIRKGIGSRNLEKAVFQVVKHKGPMVGLHKTIALPSGQVIAKWTQGGLQFTKDIPIDYKEIEKILVRYYQKVLNPKQKNKKIK